MVRQQQPIPKALLLAPKQFKTQLLALLLAVVVLPGSDTTSGRA